MKLFTSYQFLTAIIALSILIAFNASQPRAQSNAQAEFEAWISPLSSLSLQTSNQSTTSKPNIEISLYLPTYSKTNPKDFIEVSTREVTLSKVVRLLELSSESKIVSQTAINLPSPPTHLEGEYLLTIDNASKVYIGRFENNDLNDNIPLRNFLLLIQEYAKKT